MFRVPGSCYALFQCSVAPYQDTALGAARRRNNSTLSPQLLRECSVSCLWPLGVKVRSCHNTELCSVSPCGADIPCVQVLRECSACSWVLVIRNFDSRSYYSVAPLSLCHQAGRQCDAGPVLRGWSVSLSLITRDSSTWTLGNTALRSVPPCGAEARCGACAR